MQFSSKCKRLLAFSLTLFGIGCVSGCSGGQTATSKPNAEFVLNTMSFNMKYESQAGGGDPIHTWENRKEGIAECLEKYHATILGTQELQGWQYDELMTLLGPNWSGVGLPRFTADSERSSILYRNDMVEYLEGETIWLSETPSVVGSKSWNSSLPRILTYGKFLHKASNQEFYFFNTHLDHKSEEAREKGLELIVSYMEKYSAYPEILTGDFNMYLPSEQFKPITDKKDTYANTFEPFLDELNDEMKTSHGFNGGTKGQPIDFVFYTKANLTVESTQIIHDLYEDRFYLSDHYPVYSVLKLNKQEG